MKNQPFNPRALWRPKLPEIPEQCVSCPFREGNEAQFNVVLNRLRRKLGQPEQHGPNATVFAKIAVQDDLKYSGDFACHYTAYDADMNERPQSELRQCKGASEWFRSGRRNHQKNKNSGGKK